MSNKITYRVRCSPEKTQGRLDINKWMIANIGEPYTDWVWYRTNIMELYNDEHAAIFKLKYGEYSDPLK